MAERNQAFLAHEVAGWTVVPLEVTDALPDEFRRLADHHERGFMVEQVMELLPRGGPGRFTMSGGTEGS